MKWKEFKKRVEQAGIKDNDEIWYIDISFNEEITMSKDDKCGWAIAS